MAAKMANYNKRNLLNLVNQEQLYITKSWNQMRFGEGLSSGGIKGTTVEIDKTITEDFYACKDPANLHCYSLETLQKNYHDISQEFMNEANKMLDANENEIGSSNNITANSNSTIEMTELYLELADYGLIIVTKIREIMEAYEKVNNFF